MQRSATWKPSLFLILRGCNAPPLFFALTMGSPLVPLLFGGMSD